MASRTSSRRRCSPRPKRRSRPAWRAARTGATCRWSPSTRPTPRTTTTPSTPTPDPDPANPGGVIVTVAIADVAAYVRSGSALDREALKRGNSVYFPDRVVPMLPERISNDLCSLKEGEDRPALAVRMTFAADGRKLRHTFHRVMMRSVAKLSYPQAQAAIDGVPDDKTAPLLDTGPEAALGRLCRARSAAATSASRSTSTCPSARSC